MFRKTLEAVLNEKNKTEAEKVFAKNYYKHYPLIDSKSPMNMLCHYIENINFDLKQKIKFTSLKPFDWTVYQNRSVDFTDDQKDDIISALQAYLKNQSANLSLGTEDVNIDLQSVLLGVNNNIDIVTNILVQYFYETHPKSNKTLLWRYFGKHLYNNVVNNSTNEKIYFPIKAKNGEIQYLCDQYELKEVPADDKDR